MRFLGTLLLALLPSFGQAAVTVGNTASAVNPATETSLTYSMTVAPGFNRALVVVAGARPSPAVSGITFAGIALTFIGMSERSAGLGKAEAWRLMNPPATTDNIVVTYGSVAGVMSGAIALYGANRVNLIGTTHTASGCLANPATAIAPLRSDSLVLDVIATQDNTTITAGTNQTRWLDQINAFPTNLVASYEQTNGSNPVTMDWTISVSCWSQLVFEILPSTASGGDDCIPGDWSCVP